MKNNITRILMYMIGIVTLALGLTLNTKTGLGTSPIISISAAIAQNNQLNVGDVVFIQYVIFVFFEMIIHFIQKKNKKTYILDLAQIPFSIIFTRFMNVFSSSIPSFSNKSLFIRIIVLIIAIILTGIGAASMMRVKLIPNPGDGIVVAISSITKKDTGFIKNVVDFTCMILTIIYCLFVRSPIVGVGIGTIIAMMLTGRVIAIFNKMVTITF